MEPLVVFLSTPSARRATPGGTSRRSTVTDFYPRPLRGGRPDNVGGAEVVVEFLSTPSARRATGRQDHRRPPDQISIHALCEEGDGPSLTRHTKPFYFYPRPLRGGRLFELGARKVPMAFLSTPSARRATHLFRGQQPAEDISIHALCEEGDPRQTKERREHNDFYPRPLRGGRRALGSPRCIR